MEPNQIIEQIVALLSALADAGDVDESWEIQAVIDRLYLQDEPDTDGPDDYPLPFSLSARANTTSALDRRRHEIGRLNSELADRDRRIESLEEDVRLIGHLVKTVGEGAAQVHKQLSMFEELTVKMTDPESGWNR